MITDYGAAMDAIRAEVESYCEINGLDSDEFLANLDKVGTSALFDNPALLAYLELAATQLLEIIAPEKINSAEGEVLDILDIDENGQILFRNVDEDLQNMIMQMLEDDPELVAYFVMKSSGQSEADAFLNLLGSTESGTEGSVETVTAKARAMAEDMGMTDEFGWIMDNEDMYSAMQSSIYDQLEKYDQAINELIQAFSNGDLSQEAYQGQLSSMSSQREILVGLLSYSQENKSNFFQMISDMYKTINETLRNINNNIKF